MDGSCCSSERAAFHDTLTALPKNGSGPDWVRLRPAGGVLGGAEAIFPHCIRVPGLTAKKFASVSSVAARATVEGFGRPEQRGLRGETELLRWPTFPDFTTSTPWPALWNGSQKPPRLPGVLPCLRLPGGTRP